MANRSFWSSYGPLLVIGGGALLLAGTVMAAAASVGFGATVLPIEQTDRGLRLGFFRTHWCGNSRVEYREQCDDGNRVNGDGCSRWCRVEPSLCAGRTQGERFPSPDGCNVCVCNRNGIACTMRACAPRSSSSSSGITSRSSSSTPGGRKCLSSNQCPRGQYCTTEGGVCESACEPGAVVCIQACAGRCRSTQCRPYVCPDGYTAPSCTEDGHVINYFADPCLTHQSSSPARCGNGVCERGEATSCPACTYADPPCLAPCNAGTCQQDCPAENNSSSRPVSCDRTKAQFTATVNANRECRTDSDCMLFQQSCTYVTCGEAINVSAETSVRAAADALVRCIEQSGGPISCAGCVQMSVACVNNRCITRQ